MTAFRVVAFAEALSWLGLLTGMFFKYVVDAGEQGVQVFGPIHGTVFLTYLVVTLLTWRSQRWSLPVALLALAASVPPFCTVALRGVGAADRAARDRSADVPTFTCGSLASSRAGERIDPTLVRYLVISAFTFALDLALLTAACAAGSAGPCRSRSPSATPIALTNQLPPQPRPQLPVARPARAREPAVRRRRSR